jgi:glycosyltransferase involved in cell wall biosynthesis
MKTPGIGYAGSKFHNLGEAPPKVLIVAEATGGGSGRHVAELAEGLLKAGCRVHLIYSDLRAEQTFRDAVASLKGVGAHRVPMRREPHWSDMACLWQIRRYIQKVGGFDIVHAHSSKAGVLPGLPRSARARRRSTRRIRCGRWTRPYIRRSGSSTGRSRSDWRGRPVRQ